MTINKNHNNANILSQEKNSKLAVTNPVALGSSVEDQLFFKLVKQRLLEFMVVQEEENQTHE